MDKQKKYEEYLAHMKAMMEIGKELDMEVLLMDSQGNTVSATCKTESALMLLMMNMVRNDAFRIVVEIAAKHFGDEHLKGLLDAIRKTYAAREADESVNKLLRECGMK
ncbi:hypothetical protein [Prevotella sp. KH2C16]|uniref:hypothetical protein n=1 Tax=Prevotella sp. KH2C16 TaxID=1855325 RepID=UPI0008EB3BFA|nr:hypothetical protein [Prevotella sp. KH2C16]SFG13152.1 hypothetical protein SAMN05216383_105188 [Prevotella sp. KH2C16]